MVNQDESNVAMMSSGQPCLQTGHAEPSTNRCHSSALFHLLKKHALYASTPAPMFSIMAAANSLVLTLVAPGIRRSKS